METNILEKCVNCQLHKTRRRIVNNRGNPKSPLLVIVDNPGMGEEVLNNFMAGIEGKFLRDVLKEAFEEAGVSYMDYYVTGMVRCRPADSVGGFTRAPTAVEILACHNHLWKSISYTNPKHIFLVGSLAEKYLKKELPHAVTILPIKFLIKQGGKTSAWYRTTLTTIVEELKNA